MSSVSQQFLRTSATVFNDCPLTKDLGNLRYEIRRGGKVYRAVPKTAYKRGRYSWIWDHGTELRRDGTRKPDWLYNICWDRRVVWLTGTTTTTFQLIAVALVYRFLRLWSARNVGMRERRRIEIFNTKICYLEI